ncbi:hypothetical protein CC86DRAFT_437976 [Ophiobolus disseminans]|uniref:Zn(2)-C6 fungal-type domain-containing protein n=1 Tax=Ophiobolus disseminans TaxID=1469910 RepID=A0A6A7A724_9PLEO|nr:hypothetical protein CC86DRAFT_437976 [Ophiobolus disseminans]
MDEIKLRGLEKQHKLRVKTGCETCRTRKVKCDETKPSCLRCVKTGRTCDGYNHVVRPKKAGYLAAASYRNSAFLVVPQRPVQHAISKNPSRNLSQNPKENRSFEYFQLHTLPMWTEFFASELWSQTILQLSHTQPAIKHGILALSTMHERYESITPIFTSSSSDFAFVQYTQAVKHSNALLRAHQDGKVSLEMVLIACIIFTCYENLAGNYHAAAMHLKNGLRILEQNKPQKKNESQDVIANILYRFDLQAMTFSDDASCYHYGIEMAPACPHIPDVYETNSAARDDLVNLLRCMMWSVGVVEQNPEAAKHPAWHRLHGDISIALTQWERVFETYRQQLPLADQRDPKIYAGNTLLRMSALTVRIIMGAGAGLRSEMAWDAFIPHFKTVVDLAETIPLLHPRSSNTPPSTSRPIRPSPTTTFPPLASGQYSFMSTPNPIPPPPAKSPSPAPSFFSPSFELSPIVPLFIVSCRCRDPLIRRRAISLLLYYRRREGVWDSLSAGMVAAQCMKKEENMCEAADVDFSDARFLARSSSVNCAADVREECRVRRIAVAVKVVRGRIDLVYSLTTGERVGERQVIYESRGDGGGV